MSVATFSTEELANLAVVLVRDRPTYFHDRDYASDLREACKALAKISEANVACFNDRYRSKGAKAEACPAEEIEAEARAHVGASAPGDTTTLARALSTAKLLYYNCVEDIDYTLKVEGAHAALIGVLECLCDALARKGGVST